MTAVDEWDQPSSVDDFRRDQWDRPLILQPDGTRIGYTRSSTAAKTIEDTYNLERWARRNVAYGMAYDASLVARLIALGGNPAIWAKPEKDAVNKIAVDAEAVAQAHKGADIGTALHHLTHRLDRGEQVDAGPYQPDLDAYQAALYNHHLIPQIEYIECRIVNDLLRMAGSCDRIVYDETAEAWRVADIKTGASVDFGGLGWAAQCAAYAGGTLYDVATEQRMPTPPIDQRTGYIIHLPAGQGRCDIYEIDLVAGHRAAELANEIRAVRKAAKGWITPKSTWTTGAVPEGTKGDRRQEGAAHVADAMSPPPGVRIPPAPQVAAPAVGASIGERQAGGVSTPPVAETAAATVDPPPGAPPAPPVSATGGATTAVPGDADTASRRRGLRYNALLERYNALGELDRKRFDVRKQAWPERNRDDLNLVEETLFEIEATAPRDRAPSAPAVAPSPPTEGELVADVDIAALKFNYNNLLPDAQTWVAALVAEGHTAGVPWNTGSLHSERRYHLGRAIVRLAGHSFDGEYEFGIGVLADTTNDIARGLLGAATDREEVEQDSLPLGAAIGTCDATEAARFAELVDDYLSPNSAA